MGNLFVWTLPLSLSRVRVVFVSWRRAHREGLSLSVAIWSVRKNLYSAVTIRSFSLFLFFSLMVSRPPASLLLPPKLKGLSLMSCLSLRRARLSFQTSLEALLLYPAFCSGGVSHLLILQCARVCECVRLAFLVMFVSTKEIWTTSEIKSHVWRISSPK